MTAALSGPLAGPGPPGPGGLLGHCDASATGSHWQLPTSLLGPRLQKGHGSGTTDWETTASALSLPLAECYHLRGTASGR